MTERWCHVFASPTHLAHYARNLLACYEVMLFEIFRDDVGYLCDIESRGGRLYMSLGDVFGYISRFGGIGRPGRMSGSWPEFLQTKKAGKENNYNIVK